MVSVFWTAALAGTVAASPVFAQSNAITQTDHSFSFSMNGAERTISRQGPACPPSCVQPLQAAAGVATLGELELITYLQGPLSAGTGLLLDVRAPSAFAGGAIPGAVNVPFATFSPDNPYLGDLLSAFGVTEMEHQRDFGDAYTLAIYAESPGAGSAVDVIRGMIGVGYPPDKLLYYRAGVSGWTGLGLSLSVIP